MTRRIAQFALATLLTAALCASPALAQRGGNPGGPGGGGNPSGPGGGTGAGNGGPMGGNNHQHGFPDRPRYEGPQIHGFSSFPNAHGSMHMPTHGIHSMGLADRWWDNAHTAKSIGLTGNQRKQMDNIFESARPAITQRFQTVLQEQQKLNNMPSKDLADEDKVNTTIDRVTQARADLEKTTANVYSQIRNSLSAAQRARLDDAIAKQH